MCSEGSGEIKARAEDKKRTEAMTQGYETLAFEMLGFEKRSVADLRLKGEIRIRNRF